jgi:hypothetical protein
VVTAAVEGEDQFRSLQGFIVPVIGGSRALTVCCRRQERRRADTKIATLQR